MSLNEFVEKIKTHILCSMIFAECRAVYENVEEHGRVIQDTDDNIIWRIRLVRWRPKATDTHSEYSIIIDFPRQKKKLLQEGTSPCYVILHCLSYPNVRNLTTYSQMILINLK